jgi:predicted nucleotidyltransferase
MIVRKDQEIAGYAAPVIRQLLREMGSRHTGHTFVKKVLGCSDQDAVQLMRALQTAGYVSSCSGDKDPSLYSRTADGNRLAVASLRPVSRTTADRVLRGFVERIRKANSNRSFLYTITAAVVFGSAVSEAKELGDVDVAVRLERKTMDWEKHVQLSYERVWDARRKGRRFRNITEQVFWPTIEIRNFLRSRTRQLSIHEIDEVAGLPDVKYRILLGETSDLAALLPNAQIVP